MLTLFNHILYCIVMLHPDKLQCCHNIPELCGINEYKRAQTCSQTIGFGTLKSLHTHLQSKVTFLKCQCYWLKSKLHKLCFFDHGIVKLEFDTFCLIPFWCWNSNLKKNRAQLLIEVTTKLCDTLQILSLRPRTRGGGLLKYDLGRDVPLRLEK